MTAETLSPAHPLEGRRAELAALSSSLAPGLVVEPGPLVAATDLRVDPAEAGVVASLLGAAPPDTPDAWTPTADGLAIRLGPDEWLLTGGSASGPERERRLIVAVAPLGGSAVDVSAHRTSLRLRGALVRELLSFGCALDLRPRSFPRGRCAQTLVGPAGVLLVAHGVDDLELFVRTSVADHLAAWVLDAAREFLPVPAGVTP